MKDAEESDELPNNVENEKLSVEAPDGNERPIGPERQIFEPCSRLSHAGSLMAGLKPKKAPMEEMPCFVTMLWQVSPLCTR